MQTSVLSATLRNETGKGPARRLRAKELIPAILYGPHVKQAVGLAVNPDQLRKAIATPKKFNTIITLKLDDGSERPVLFKTYDVDPVFRTILHADFLELRLDEKIKVKVPLVLTGKPVGVVDGGILSQARYELEVWCLPKDIPEKVEIDVTALKIGHSLHVKDVKFPPGVEGKYAVNFTVAAVVAPEKEEEVAAAAVPGAEAEAAAALGEAVPGAPVAAPAPGAAPAAAGAAPASGKPGAASAARAAPGAAPAKGATAPVKGAPTPGKRGKEAK